MVRIARTRPARYIAVGDLIAYDPHVTVTEEGLISELELHRVMSVHEGDAGITFELMNEGGEGGVLKDVPEDALLFRGEY